MSDYFHIREYSDICMIMSQNGLKFEKMCHNIFKVRAGVSIDTKIHMYKIRAYGT